jgi:hypothetical protein
MSVAKALVTIFVVAKRKVNPKKKEIKTYALIRSFLSE